jgi:hypothetical protein
MWHAIKDPSEAPSDRDLRLAVISNGEVHALVFPCRKANDGWINVRSGRTVEVWPTHWQDWNDDPQAGSTRH